MVGRIFPVLCPCHQGCVKMACVVFMCPCLSLYACRHMPKSAKKKNSSFQFCPSFQSVSVNKNVRHTNKLSKMKMKNKKEEDKWHMDDKPMKQ